MNCVRAEAERSISARFSVAESKGINVEKEFNAATTVEERTAVMKKYKVGPFRDGAEGVIPED